MVGGGGGGGGGGRAWDSWDSGGESQNLAWKFDSLTILSQTKIVEFN